MTARAFVQDADGSGAAAAETARAQAAEATLIAQVAAMQAQVNGIVTSSTTLGVPPRIVRDLGTAADTTNSTTVPVVTTNSVAAGDTIIAVVVSAGGSAQALSSVSGGGLTWRIAGSMSNGSGPTVSVATAAAPAGLASGTTITPTIGTASAKKAVYIFEVTGLVDAAALAVSAGNSSSSATTIQTGSAISTQADNEALALAVFAVSEAQTSGQWSLTDSSWTKLASTSVGSPVLTALAAYQAVDAGTLTPAGTITGAAAYAGLLVILQASPITPSVPVANLIPAQPGGQLRIRSGRVAWVASQRKYVDDFGALDDGQCATTGAITSGQALVTCPASPFAPSDAGKIFAFEGAGAAGATLTGTISGYNSPSSVTVNVAAGTTVSSGMFWWGSDNTAAFESTISKVGQVSGALAGRVGGMVVAEGSCYLFAPAGGTGIQIGLGATRQSIRLIGGGGSSSIEGGAHGTTLVAAKAGMVLVKDDGQSMTPDLFGCEVEGINAIDVAGGCTLFQLIRTNRCHFRSVVARGRSARKDTIGLELNAQGFDSSWHVLDEFRGIYCDKVLHVIEGYGTYWQSGEAEQCNYGYYGEKARHTEIGVVEFNELGATAIYEKGGFLTVTAAHIETAASSAASTGINIAPGANSPIDGAGIEICAGTKILGQNGVSQYGVILGAGTTAARVDFYTRSLRSANRVVNNTGLPAGTFRGWVIDPVNGNLDVGTI